MGRERHFEKSGGTGTLSGFGLSFALAPTGYGSLMQIAAAAARLKSWAQYCFGGSMKLAIALGLCTLLLGVNSFAEEFATPQFVLNLPKGWNKGPVTNLGTSVGYEFRSSTSASYALVVVNSTWAPAKEPKEEQERHVKSLTTDSIPEGVVTPRKLERCQISGTQGYCAVWERKGFRGESVGWMTTDGLVIGAVIAIASEDTENLWTDLDHAIRTIVPVGRTAAKEYHDGLIAYSQRDYAKALSIFQQIASTGDAQAQWALGGMYEDGLGINRDWDRAFELYRKSAEQGFAEGQSALGWMYSQGRGVKQNKIEAVRWFNLAAAQGNKHGEYNLALMYLNGDGVKQDSAQALQWFERAADQNYPNAEYMIGTLYRDGKGVTADKNVARKWLERARDHGYNPAHEALLELDSSR